MGLGLMDGFIGNLPRTALEEGYLNRPGHCCCEIPFPQRTGLFVRLWWSRGTAPQEENRRRRGRSPGLVVQCGCGRLHPVLCECNATKAKTNIHNTACRLKRHTDRRQYEEGIGKETG